MTDQDQRSVHDPSPSVHAAPLSCPDVERQIGCAYDGTSAHEWRRFVVPGWSVRVAFPAYPLRVNIGISFRAGRVPVVAAGSSGARVRGLEIPKTVTVTKRGGHGQEGRGH